MHVTGYLGDEPLEGVLRFIDIALQTRYFDEVWPVRRGDGAIIAVAMYSRTLGVQPAFASGIIADMCRRLGGILSRSTEFATAWDIADRSYGKMAASQVIPGRGPGTVQGQVVADYGELPAAVSGEPDE